MCMSPYLPVRAIGWDQLDWLCQALCLADPELLSEPERWAEWSGSRDQEGRTCSINWWHTHVCACMHACDICILISNCNFQLFSKYLPAVRLIQWTLFSLYLQGESFLFSSSLLPSQSSWTLLFSFDRTSSESVSSMHVSYPSRWLTGSYLSHQHVSIDWGAGKKSTLAVLWVSFWGWLLLRQPQKRDCTSWPGTPLGPPSGPKGQAYVHN